MNARAVKLVLAVVALKAGYWVSLKVVLMDTQLVDDLVDLWGSELADVKVDLLASAKASLLDNRRESKTETAWE